MLTGTLFASVDKVSHDFEQNEQTEQNPQEAAKEFIGAAPCGRVQLELTSLQKWHALITLTTILPSVKLWKSSFSQHTWWQTWPNLCLFGSNAFAWPKLEKVSLITLNIPTFHHRNTNVSNYGFAIP